MTHRLADELTTVEPFTAAFGGWRRPAAGPDADAYARLLYRLGFADPKVQLIVYPHVLASREDVVEWVKEDVYDRFVDEYRRGLLGQLDEERPFFYRSSGFVLGTTCLKERATAF